MQGLIQYACSCFLHLLSIVFLAVVAFAASTSTSLHSTRSLRVFYAFFIKLLSMLRLPFFWHTTNSKTIIRFDLFTTFCWMYLSFELVVLFRWGTTRVIGRKVCLVLDPAVPYLLKRYRMAVCSCTRFRSYHTLSSRACPAQFSSILASLDSQQEQQLSRRHHDDKLHS